jgi:hypothetical protein
VGSPLEKETYRRRRNSWRKAKRRAYRLLSQLWGVIPTEWLVGKYRADRKPDMYQYDGNRRKRMGPPYQEKGPRWCVEQLGRTVSSVVNKAHALGIAGVGRVGLLNNADDMFLIEHYDDYGVNKCAEELGRTRKAVYHRASKLGLTKLRWCLLTSHLCAW